MKKYFKFITLAVLVAMIAACAPAAAPAAEAPAAAAPAAEAPAAAAPAAEAPAAAAPAAAGTGADFDEFPRPRIVADGKLKVAYVIRQAVAESQIRSYQQAEVECAHRGWTFIPIVNKDVSEVRDAILSAINQDVDVLLIGNQESMPSFEDVIAQAREKGIGVYNNDNQLVKGVIANSTMPNGVSAMELMYTIGEAINWTGNIALVGIPTIQVSNERILPMEGTINSYPGMKLVENGDLTTDPAGPVPAANNLAKTYLEKYGADNLRAIISFFDNGGMAAGEAIAAAGDPEGKKTLTAGIDGGTQAWAAIRKTTPFQFSYAQPFELYTHKLFELMDQIQVKGLNPGDPGCSINKVGATMYSSGLVVTRANVPAVGQPIHAVYGYYGMDPEDMTAWYNWNEGPGIYKIEGGE